MKHTLFLGLAVIAIGLSACSRPATDETKNAGSESSGTSVAVVAGTAEKPREILIEVGDHMKFSLARIDAAAGEVLRVILSNTGNAPKEAMGHNWVLLRAGVDATSYANAAVGAKTTDYIPAARASDVLAHTKLLGGRSRDAVVFTVPADAALGTEFAFLCTFPAHLQLGMKGVLAVR